ncbi:MAG: serine hydrolase domain-containing protein [Lysobacter sp.]
MKKFVTAMVVVLAVVSFPAIAASAHGFNELAGFIQRTKDATALPSGTAVAVVKNGKVIYEGYFGFADINGKKPVDRDTAFYIASTTKPFVALNALLKAEEGRLDTQTSLQAMFPEIRFNGFDATSVTVKDLLVHSSGVENQSLVWATAFSGVHDAQSRRALVAASYRDGDGALGTFNYTNVGYNILSVWLDQKLAMPWQDQLDEAIFQPLDMRRTSAYISEAEAKGWPLAKPYSFAGVHPNAPLYLSKADDTMHAAGGLVSTAPDLAKFLIAQLADGKYAGKQIFHGSVITQSHVPQVVTDSSYLDFKRTGYAWGWYTGDYKRKSMLHHFGGFAGFHAHLSFIPEANVGLVVLNNEDVLSARLTNLIADYVYGVLLDEPAISSKMSNRFDELLVQAWEGKSATAKHRDMIQARAWHLSQPLEAYVGTYTNDLLGEVIVELNNDKNPVVRWGRLAAVATGYDGTDQVRVEFAPNEGVVLSFVVKDGRVDAISFAHAKFKKAP